MAMANASRQRVANESYAIRALMTALHNPNGFNPRTLPPEAHDLLMQLNKPAPLRSVDLEEQRPQPIITQDQGRPEQSFITPIRPQSSGPMITPRETLAPWREGFDRTEQKPQRLTSELTAGAASEGKGETPDITKTPGFDEVVADLEIAEAGYRIIDGEDTRGVPSTFPSYLKNKGYRKKELDAVIDKIESGKKLGPKQKEIADILFRVAADNNERFKMEAAKEAADPTSFNTKEFDKGDMGIEEEGNSFKQEIMNQAPAIQPQTQGLPTEQDKAQLDSYTNSIEKNRRILAMLKADLTNIKKGMNSWRSLERTTEQKRRTLDFNAFNSWIRENEAKLSDSISKSKSAEAEADKYQNEIERLKAQDKDAQDYIKLYNKTFKAKGSN